MSKKSGKNTNAFRKNIQMYWRRVKNNRVSKKIKKIAKIKTYFLIKMSKKSRKNTSALRKNIQIYWRRVKIIGCLKK